jgi:hypothetical protein
VAASKTRDPAHPWSLCPKCLELKFQSSAGQYESADASSGVEVWKCMPQKQYSPEGARVYKGRIWAIKAEIPV